MRAAVRAWSRHKSIDWKGENFVHTKTFYHMFAEWIRCILLLLLLSCMWMECSFDVIEKDNNATRNQRYDIVMITYQTVDYFSNREGKSFIKMVGIKLAVVVVCVCVYMFVVIIIMPYVSIRFRIMIWKFDVEIQLICVMSWFDTTFFVVVDSLQLTGKDWHFGQFISIQRHKSSLKWARHAATKFERTTHQLLRTEELYNWLNSVACDLISAELFFQYSNLHTISQLDR